MAQTPRTDQGFDRRTLFAGTGAAAVAVALAACSTDGGGPRSGGSDGGGSDALVPAGTALAATTDVPVGGALSVTVKGAPLLVTQPEEGTFAAFSAICTHQGCTVLPGNGELKCPCHGSEFDLATGKVRGGPAPATLPEVNVTVSGTSVTSA